MRFWGMCIFSLFMCQTIRGQRRPLITCPANSESAETPNYYSMCICNSGYISNINSSEEYECIHVVPGNMRKISNRVRVVPKTANPWWGLMK